ncbi:FAD:protein FMN transferase [Nonomuraea sp. NPDC047897]|uniref:FAD:protein FMN transferase n=1 Tax=Nonomuraea sp. NPDC047897 TaxID=3364346 RepID=UPI00371E5D49
MVTTFPGTTRAETISGIPVSVDIRTALPRRELAPLLDDAFAWLRWVDETFSPARADSQIGRLNGGRTIEQIPELVEVLHRCDALSERTGGWFEARINGVIDPSGYIKGWALERLSRALTNAGAVDHRLDAGGDIRLRGSAAPGRPWRTAIRDPRSGLPRRTVAAYDLAIATSGGAPVLNPRTGGRQSWPGAVTVVGPDLGVADAYATAMYAMGPVLARRFATELAEAEPYQTLVIGRDGKEVATPGFAAYTVAEDRLVG